MKYLLVILFCSMILVSCKEDYIPKPKGYFRIDLPDKSYQHYHQSCPYYFEHPVYSKIVDYITDSCWINVYFPDQNANIYLTYKTISNNLSVYLNETRSMVYKHTVKADAINEYLLTYPERDVYSVLYEIKGNAASSVNFFATDSVNHFLRGSLYFNNKPNYDSLKPVIQFIYKDIEHLIATLEWEKSEK